VSRSGREEPMQASRIDDIAAEWAARLDREPLSPEDRAQLEAWLAQDIRHQGAFARARAVFASFDKARALGADYDPQAFADAPPAPRPSRRAIWAAAAAVVALGGGGLLAYRATLQDYRTDK